MKLFKSTIAKLKQGLSRTRGGLISSLRAALTGKTLSPELLRDIEAKMLQADIGVVTSTKLINELREAWKKGDIKAGDQALAFLKDRLIAGWPQADRQLNLATPAGSGPSVLFVAGVNGAGKTTSIAKLAKTLRDDGQSVMLAACDTFRAAAVEQLETWSNRLGVNVVKGKQGGDPAAVAFDACDAALTRHADVLIVDTAGRLHTQDPLMRQLTKIRSVCAKKIPGAPHEVILVLDATTGQNAINQAKIFIEAVDVTGIFLAKLDGTAKGGIVVAIRDQLGIPVKFVGIGETPDDVQPFDPVEFVEALFAD